MEQIASVVGIASALVGAAFACAKWKRKMNSTSTSAIQTTVARSTDMTSSRSTASATVPQSTDVILRCQVNQIQCKDQEGQVLACTGHPVQGFSRQARSRGVGGMCLSMQ